MNNWPCIIGTILITFCVGRWLLADPHRWHVAVAFITLFTTSAAVIIGWMWMVFSFFEKLGWMPEN